MLLTLRQVAVVLLAFSFLCGVIYPAVVTGIAQFAFPTQAQGSLIKDKDGNAIGSELIGQPFSDPKYFWGRLSATGPMPYNASASSGSNLSNSSTALLDAVKSRIAALEAADPGNTQPVPVDLVTASASGLDPHISIAAAYYQIGRVAKLRGVPEEALKEMIDKSAEGRIMGILGEPVVNVLKLNLALDNMITGHL